MPLHSTRRVFPCVLVWLLLSSSWAFQHAHAEPAPWGQAKVRRTVLETQVDFKLSGTMVTKKLVSMATSATRNGCHVAKIEGSPLDGYRVIYDGQPGPFYNEIARETPVFSEDGRSIAYAALKDSKWRWVVNGVEGPGYSEITPTSFAFSADGQHHAYVMVPRYRQTVFVVDGKVRAEGEWSGIMPWNAAPVLSPDGSRVAFVEVDQSARLMRVNLNGSTGPWHPGIALCKSTGFGAFSATTGTESAATQFATPYVEDRAQPNVFSMCFSPDGRRFTYATFTQEGKSIQLVDGKTLGPHDHTGFDFVFSPDGQKYAYMALDGERRCIIAEGEEPLPMESIYDGSLTFSPDGRHLAFAGSRNGEKAVYLDGQAVPCEVKMDGYKNSQPIVFSPDSKRIAFSVISQGTGCWVIDGKAGTPSKFVGLGLSFSPDSRHFSYIIKDEAEGVAVVVDGEKRAAYPSVTSGPVFRQDGVLEFIAADGSELCRFEIQGL